MGLPVAMQSSPGGKPGDDKVVFCLKKVAYCATQAL